MRTAARTAALAVVLFAGLACRGRPVPPRAAAPGAPGDSEIPHDAYGAAVRRGLALLTATRDSLPGHVGNALRCTSCHLDAGRRESGTWIGSFARFPQYRSRRGAVELIEDRVNDCFRRSLNGTALAADGPDMRDIVAYLAFLSWRAANGPPAPGNARLQRFAALHSDTAAGRETFHTVCARCHGAGGEGTVSAPPVWGPRSFNIGAGMARVRTAASFIRDNMPFDQPGTLSDQQAFDVAAFVVAQPRPDLPGKEYDWPNGDPPPDVAYATLAATRKAAVHRTP
jgi:thiosulfate dehydrogenase